MLTDFGIDPILFNLDDFNLISPHFSINNFDVVKR